MGVWVRSGGSEIPIAAESQAVQPCNRSCAESRTRHLSRRLLYGAAPVRRSTSLVSLLAGACLALGAAACGDDEDSGGLSKAEFTRQADAICEKAVLPQGKETRRVQEQAPILERNAKGREDALKKIEALDASDDVKSEADAYLKATRELVAVQRKQAGAARKGDVTAFQDIDVDGALASAKRSKAAAEFGFEKCGQPVQGEPIDAKGFTSPELIEQADAACRKATESNRKIKPENPNDLRSLGETNEKLVPAQEEALRAIKALEPPAEDRQEWDRFVEVFEQRVENASGLAKAGKANDQQEFEQVATRDRQQYDQENQIASRLGLEVCGQASPLGV